MTTDQILIFIVLFVMLVLFASNRIRFEIVALGALVVSVLLGLVPHEKAFAGFGHNAVITVIGILVIGQGLFESGFVENMVDVVGRYGKTRRSQMALLLGGVAVFSSVMNNIGALTLFMPVGIQMARKNNYSPSTILMPMAFASLMGGMITLIGSPPNIIISSIHKQYFGTEMGMFQFAPLGISITVVGILFIMLIGWRLIPDRKSKISREDVFSINEYTTVVRLTANSLLSGKRIVDLNPALFRDVNIIGYVRSGEKHNTISPYQIMYEGDKLIIEAGAQAIHDFIQKSHVVLAATKPESIEEMLADNYSIQEVVVKVSSNLIGQTAKSMNLRSAYGVNLLAVAREGERLNESPNRIRIQAGDVLLLLGSEELILELIDDVGVYPLAERKIRIGGSPKATLSIMIFAAALLVVTFGILPSDITFAIGALAMVLSGVLSVRSAYLAIDLPIVILLGALIPVSQALETTGAAALISNSLLQVAQNTPSWVTLLLLLVTTLILTNIINNAAAALLLAPIAVGLAQQLGHSVDPYLMSVFVGATSAFLTPIGHASCTVVMGPGGYHFGDYWKLGLPLSIITCAVAIPVILVFFPF